MARRSGKRLPAKRPFSRKSQVRRDQATVRKVLPLRGVHMMSRSALHEMAVAIRRTRFSSKKKKHRRR